MKKRAIYLHIGSHKTGSTSIQRSLFNNPQHLERNGFSIICARGRKNGNFLFRFTGDRQHSPGAELVDFERFFNRAADINTANLIVSAETMSWMHDLPYMEILRKKALEIFDQAIIICYIRRQDKLAISHYQEAAKQRSRVECAFYGTSPTALPVYSEHLHHYLDFHRKLGLWADVFGDQNIRIRLFEPEELTNGDAVEDFYHLLGIPASLTTIKSNTSNGFIKTKVGHLLNEHVQNTGVASEIRKGLDNEGKLLPSREEAEAFYLHFRASNTRLNRRFNINSRESLFEENFDFYPSTREDLWYEDSANMAIVQIMESIDRMTYPLNPDSLREAAEALEGTNLRLSYDLMKMAQALRSEGPRIKRKLSEYRERLGIED